jgi:AcrR family transcriptional regulator
MECVMPYSSEHKAATRARIVDSARRLFNRFGFEQVSIEQVMSEAGLTRGGFYHHFDCKDALYAEAVASFNECNPFRQNLKEHPPESPAQLARSLLELYLSDEVLANVEMHCPLYALPGDVARAGLMPQRAYTDLIRGLTQVYAMALEHLPDGEQRAQSIVALCVGGMVLARTTDDPELRRTLRQSARRQALTLLAV